MPRRTLPLKVRRELHAIATTVLKDKDTYLPMADGPDVIKFDPGLGRIYAACYSGAISIFHLDDPEQYRKLGDFKVQHVVHSLAVDPDTHRVYTPEQEGTESLWLVWLFVRLSLDGRIGSGEENLAEIPIVQAISCCIVHDLNTACITGGQSCHGARV